MGAPVRTIVRDRLTTSDIGGFRLVCNIGGDGNDAATISIRPEVLMDRNVDYNSEQKAPDNATATRSSPFMGRPVPAVEPKAMDFEAWRVQLRSLCGRYSPEGVEPHNFVGSLETSSVWGCAAVDASCKQARAIT
jgi:hypothetical protein